MPARHKAPKPTQPRKKPQRKAARPKIRLAAVKAIVHAHLRLAVQHLEGEEDGMDRLIRALRRSRPKAKRKAG